MKDDVLFRDFTDHAIRVMDLAREEAVKRGHRYVGTAHLLLALLVDKGIAQSILTEASGVTYEKVDRLFVGQQS